MLNIVDERVRNQVKDTRIAGTPYDARQADQVQELARNYKLACRIRGVARKAADLPVVWNVEGALANPRTMRTHPDAKHTPKDAPPLSPSTPTSSSPWS